MTLTDQALLRDWELLQGEVVPSLLQSDHERPPRSWSIGTIEDAVSIAVAYQHARGRRPSGGMQFYATAAGQEEEVGFRRGDLRGIPDDSRLTYFVHDDARRWVPAESIADRVVLSTPSEPVDVVTFRAGSGDRGFDAAVDRVRQGGQLLVIGSDQLGGTPDCLEPVSPTATGFMFRKRTPATPVDGDYADDAAEGEPLQTLARLRAQRKLVENHTKLAASLARRFAHHGEPADDLQQVAMLALVKAAKRFDPGRDTRFATYATASILGELKRHFRDKSWTMRVPRHLQETYLSVKQARDDLTQTLGAEPTVDQIAKLLETKPEEVTEALGAGDNFWAASLEGRFRDESEVEIPVVDGSFEQALDRMQMQSRLETLDSEELLVLQRLYFDERTQREVAAEIGVSQMQVSRLQSRALAKLRS